MLKKLKNEYSVIIPTLNEESRITRTIGSVREIHASCEIIVVDGGSDDSTITKAQQAGATVISSSAGRGIQMNTGSRIASGDILLFLHADTILPESAFQILDQYFQNPAVQIGTFRLSFDDSNPILHFYACFTRRDSIFTRFGDQCIVVRKSFFKKCGDFPEWPIFEDVQFLRNARKKTKIYSFPAAVITSARRFLKLGVIHTQLLNGWLILQYLLGASPEKLAKQYYRFRSTKPVKQKERTAFKPSLL